MRIRITPKQVTDNGYNKISPYYRQRVLFPETANMRAIALKLPCTIVGAICLLNLTNPLS